MSDIVERHWTEPDHTRTIDEMNAAISALVARVTALEDLVYREAQVARPVEGVEGYRELPPE